MLTRRQRGLLLLPFVVIVVPFMIAPALIGFAATFTNYKPFARHIEFVGAANFARILDSEVFRAAFGNVAVFAVVTVTASLALGFLIAYTLREPFRGRTLLRLVLLVPWLVSPVASGVLWSQFLSIQHGIVNLLPALIGWHGLPSPLQPGLALYSVMLAEVWRKAPLVAFLTLPGLLALPSAQWDYAHIEGASAWARIWRIALPQLRPLLLTIALLLIGEALGTAESILMLTGGGPGTETTTPALVSYRTAYEALNWSSGATSSWVIVAAMLLVGAVYLRLVKQGFAPSHLNPSPTQVERGAKNIFAPSPRSGGRRAGDEGKGIDIR